MIYYYITILSIKEFEPRNDRDLLFDSKAIRKLTKLFDTEKFSWFFDEIDSTISRLWSDKHTNEEIIFRDRHPESELYKVIVGDILMNKKITWEKAFRLINFYQYCEIKLQYYDRVTIVIWQIDTLKKDVAHRSEQIKQWNSDAQSKYDAAYDKYHKVLRLQTKNNYADGKIYLLRWFIRFFKNGILDRVQNHIDGLDPVYLT